MIELKKLKFSKKFLISTYRCPEALDPSSSCSSSVLPVGVSAIFLAAITELSRIFLTRSAGGLMLLSGDFTFVKLELLLKL